MTIIEWVLLIVWSLVILFALSFLWAIVEAEYKKRKEQKNYQDWADKRRGE